MKAMLAIYKRELKSYFHSFVGLLFIGVTLFFIGLYFSVYNLLNGYPYFSYALSSVTTMLLIEIPILTMRILAEERRNKTDQLTLTAPISVGGIVMGKFLALVTILAIPLEISCIYPLLMSRYGTVPMGDAYLAVLAFFLFGVACIAICMLVSSLTESQVIAAVLSFLLLFLGFMMSSICSLISSTGNLLTKILGCFDIYTPFSNLLNGTLNLDCVVYFVSLTALLLFLTTQSIQKRRYSVSVKNLRTGAYSTGMIAIAVAIVVIVNLILGEMPTIWTSIDLTSQKLYSLTEQSKEFVATIEEDVTIYVLNKESDQDVTLGQTLQRFDDLSDHITVEYVDPNVNPRFASQYSDTSLNYNSLIVVSDKRSKVIDYSKIYETDYNYNTTGYDGEGQITSALNYVLSDDMPKVYMTEGHGEYSFSSTFTAALEKGNITYETINLMDVDSVPEDAACIIINGAVTDFSGDDKDKVISYLDNGGKLVLIVGYTDEATPNLDELLAYVDIELADGLVVEEDTDNYYRIPYYLLPTVKADTYTAGIYGQYYIFAPFVQGLIVPEESEGITYTSFLTTSDSAFSKVDISNMQDYSKTEGDIDGPFAIGVEAVKTLDEGEATVVVYSCDQLFTDDANEMVSGANLTLFTNTISGFADYEVSSSVPVKDYEVSYLTVTQTDAIVIMLVTTMVLPLGCLIVGFVIWFRRRKR